MAMQFADLGSRLMPACRIFARKSESEERDDEDYDYGNEGQGDDFPN